MHNASIEIGGRTLSIDPDRIETGADGSCVVQYGDTIVLVTACMSKDDTEEIGWFPLTVNYREKTDAAGRIPGGFFKREGRPRDKEIVTARLIDRPIRPLFPEEFSKEIQIVGSVLSSDQETDGDILAMIGASSALTVSSIPFLGPIGAVRIGKVGREFIVNPTATQLEESDLNLVVAGTEQGITMIEASTKELSERTMLQAIEIAASEIDNIIKAQKKLRKASGKIKISSECKTDEKFKTEISKLAIPKLAKALNITERSQRRAALDETLKELEEKYPERNEVQVIFESLKHQKIREKTLREGKRLDGRALSDIRPTSCEIGLLPRAHGSALFRRGDTQSLCTVTLGTTMDEQKIEELTGETWKSFMLHYNFPPFSVGEVRPLRGPGRREIGHGFLAERALSAVIPPSEVFPYTIRIVSDILSSNGSSSMATVCGGSLSLMDAGIPIKTHVAGIALGLIEDTILTDILGEEDHAGDMDFKVAGTREGITALQLDVKTKGISLDTIGKALEAAKEARFHILDIMDNTISKARGEVSQYAPKIVMLDIAKDKIGQLIGPGGKVIRDIIDRTGAKIEIDDANEKVSISSPFKEVTEEARKAVEQIIGEVKVGKIYIAKVKRLLPFGAIVELFPGKEGMIHVSQMAHYRVKNVEDELKIGDEVPCRVIGIDEQGRISLSRKALLHKDEL
jgi:polyribonucleotide nucleotidyltransferase